MTEKTGLTQTAIVRIWQAFGLQLTVSKTSSFPKTRSLSRRFDRGN